MRYDPHVPFSRVSKGVQLFFHSKHLLYRTLLSIAPDEEFPSLSIELCLDRNPEKGLAKLRKWNPPIIGTISAGKVRLNLATIAPYQIPQLRACLQMILAEPENLGIPEKSPAPTIPQDVKE